MSGLRVFSDHNGITYDRVDIVSNGLCGYSCIAYCITGNSHAFEDMIMDSFNAFEMNPELFMQQTELGRTVSLQYYKDIMTNALGKIPSQSLPRALWMEDGHIVAYSLMFDVCVFVYNVVLNEWLAYNENAHRGYVCLLFNGSHYDVLIGQNSILRLCHMCQRLLKNSS